jgi:hypothetical protein
MADRKKKVQRTNKHHRKSRANGGTDHPDNLVVVPQRMHNFYHAFFSEGTHPPEMAIKLTRWIDPDWVMIAVEKHHAREIMKVLRQLV